MKSGTSGFDKNLANDYIKRRRTYGEKFIDDIFKNGSIAMSLIIALVLLSIIIYIGIGSIDSIRDYGLKFLIKSEWDPVTDNYGAFTAIYGTMLTSLASLFIAIPLGIGSAIVLTENILPSKLTTILSLMIELLASIPSVVLGLWAIFIMEPFIRPFLTTLNDNFDWIPFLSTEPIGPGIAPAILILTIMILPIITAISRDSIRQVPIELREAAYGIGATRWTTILNVIIPAAISGIIAGILLGLGRAMGETMAVAMIIGNSNNFSLSILAPGNTISSMLASQFGEADGSQVSSLLYAAFILMILTLAVNILAQWIVRRLSLKY